jgi:plastocyanin
MRMKGSLVSMAIAMATSSSALAGEITGTVSGVKDPENVVVYLERAPGTFKAPEKGAVMDQMNIRFVPHVLPVLSGTEVRFPNSDTVRHSVFSPSKAKKFNLGIYPPGTIKTVVMDIPGAQVVSLLCAIHAQLAGYIVVLQNPYFALANKEGSYAILNVPPGDYRVIAWHEKQPDLPKQSVAVPATGSVDANFAFTTDYGRTGN